MKNRLQEFMTKEGLTAVRLSEIVGVQPSAISHILSGRNYPGFDFISSILKAYPTLNARWFLLGEGAMYGNMYKYAQSSGGTQIDASASLVPDGDMSVDVSPLTSLPPSELKSDEILPIISNIEKKSLDKIVMFYSDGTFFVYEN